MYTVYAQEKGGTDQTSDMNSEANPSLFWLNALKEHLLLIWHLSHAEESGIELEWFWTHCSGMGPLWNSRLMMLTQTLPWYSIALWFECRFVWHYVELLLYKRLSFFFWLSKLKASVLAGVMDITCWYDCMMDWYKPTRQKDMLWFYWIKM